MTISGKLGDGAAAVGSVAGFTTGLVAAGEEPGTASALCGGSPAGRANLHCRTFVGMGTTGHLQRESEQGPGTIFFPTLRPARATRHPSAPCTSGLAEPLQT